MSDSDDNDPTRDGGRPLRRQGEEVIGRIAQELLQSPVVSGALTTVFETRERATRAQELAMSALNLPSAADIERLTRRVRSVAQRIEGLEDGLDRVGDRLEKVASTASLDTRLAAIEASLERIETALASATESARATSADGQESGDA
jgi:predicted  nucleic acid-binding Zn-ribbon protein